MESAVAVGLYRGTVKAQQSVPKARRATVCAHPAHQMDYTYHHHLGVAKESAGMELHMPSSPLVAAFSLAKPHPSLFSTDAAHKASAPSVHAEASPAEPSSWAHPYPENPKRWKVDEDAWYVPPEGWMQRGA